MNNRHHNHGNETDTTEETSMTITRHPRQRGENRTCNHRSAHAAGRRFGEHARGDWRANQHQSADAPHLEAMLRRMMAKIERIEQRVAALQHEKAAEQPVVRRPRYSGQGKRHNDNRVNQFGRRMGSISRHAWRDRHPEA